MEFKKCNRCGCFFVSEHNVCEHCNPKDTFELSKLRKKWEVTGMCGVKES